LGSGRTVEVRINDRGPFIAGRILDLSKAAADIIGLTASGVARVSMTVLGR
jgi:rare lipoprotein A